MAPPDGIRAPAPLPDHVGGLEALAELIWQGHRSLLDPDPDHNTAEEMIANLEETDACEGHWLRASVQQDGTFTVTNGRNGFSRTYTAR